MKHRKPDSKIPEDKMGVTLQMNRETHRKIKILAASHSIHMSAAYQMVLDAGVSHFQSVEVTW